jgi:hypothetical protein
MIIIFFTGINIKEKILFEKTAKIKKILKSLINNFNF